MHEKTAARQRRHGNVLDSGWLKHRERVKEKGKEDKTILSALQMFVSSRVSTVPESQVSACCAAVAGRCNKLPANVAKVIVVKRGQQ